MATVARRLSIALLSVVVVAAACFGGPQRRPVGFFRLGPVASLGQSEQTFFSESKIMLRHDQGGFFAMSTACSYDLSPLLLVEKDGELIWRSQLSESTYAPDGSVLHGPTKNPLPYYQLNLAAGNYGGASDTLFVKVGVERSASWRLLVP
ncbi:MAG: hypothetical protein NTV65_00125 [Proteobacteria bacterium]|nr:hypothetical protein [Pseudomonadota bacterium]